MAFESQTTIANRQNYTNTFTAEYDANQNGITIITPTTGKRLVVRGVYFSTEGGTANGNMVSLTLGGDTVFKAHATTTPTQNSNGDILFEGGVDVPLKLTSDLGGSKSYFLAINYREE